MKIQTKYDIGDKVWVLGVPDNTYMWGKIVSFDISNRANEIETTYQIENRFYEKSEIAYFSRNWKNERYLDYREDMVFSSESELIDYVEANNDKRLMEMTELKKGFFC